MCCGLLYFVINAEQDSVKVTLAAEESPLNFLCLNSCQPCTSLFENTALTKEQIMIYVEECGTDEQFLRSLEGLKFSGLNHKNFSF